MKELRRVSADHDSPFRIGPVRSQRLGTLYRSYIDDAKPMVDQMMNKRIDCARCQPSYPFVG